MVGLAMLLQDPGVSSARARAAVGFAGYARGYKRLAEDSGISKATLARILSPTQQHGTSIEQLFAIADACKVPRRFMVDGFEPLLGGIEDYLQTITTGELPDDREALVREMQEVADRSDPPSDNNEEVLHGRQGKGR